MLTGAKGWYSGPDDDVFVQVRVMLDKVTPVNLEVVIEVTADNYSWYEQAIVVAGTSTVLLTLAGYDTAKFQIYNVISSDSSVSTAWDTNMVDTGPMEKDYNLFQVDIVQNGYSIEITVYADYYVMQDTRVRVEWDLHDGPDIIGSDWTYLVMPAYESSTTFVTSLSSGDTFTHPHITEVVPEEDEHCTYDWYM